MDLNKIPPIQQKRIITFVNHFIIDTVSFLNKFINSAENTLWKLEKKMRKLELTLKLLEAKLNSIPELKDTEVSEQVPITSNETSETRDATPATTTQDETAETEDSPVSPEEEIPAEVQKYVKMVKFGVPVEAVKLKMVNEGLDPSLLKL